MARFSLSMYLVLLSVAVFSHQVASQIDYGEINISETPRLTLNHEGDSGTLIFNGTVSDSPNPTTIRIQAKPNCYISISPDSKFSFDRCSYGFQMSSCVSGCFHMYLFDAYYYNNTMMYMWDSTWKEFNTSSHVLYVGVCHMSRTSSNIRLRFKSVERKFEFHGDSVHARTGQVASPYFPAYYEQNGEQTTYLFHSRFISDKVVIEFDDFDIAPGGYLYFDPTRDYPTPVKVTDNTNRLVVTSTANQLQFIFDHGWPGESYRKHLGFKLTYKFISESESYYAPITYCGRYYLTLRGGHIEFKPNRYDKPYDCVWVVKTQPGYTGTFMNLERFSLDFTQGIHPGDVYAEIHKGLTSNGTMVGKLIPSSGLSRDYNDPDGFYIRLRGTFRTSVTFKMAFTSYTNFYASGCDTRDHFKCSTGMCILNLFACDHVKHCKDGSDETFGCSNNFDNRSKDETITVSVVIPVVVSIFLLIVLCIMFVLIRRCRQARQFNNMMESSEPVVCTTDRHRRRRRHDFFQRPPDAPPTYDEALITGIPVPDDGYDGPPKPPTYSEATITPLIPEHDFPSPPYTSRENINESFLEEQGDAVICRARRHLLQNDQEPTPENTSEGTGESHQSYNMTDIGVNNRQKLNILSSGRLPHLPSISATVGTQSMCNISDVGGNNKLIKTRSEQILAPNELGVVNPAFTDDQGRQSRLYRGQAVSSLDLPTNSRQTGDLSKGHSDRGYTRSNLDIPSSFRNVKNNNLSPAGGKYPFQKDGRPESLNISRSPTPGNHHQKDTNHIQGHGYNKKSNDTQKHMVRNPNDKSAGNLARNYTDKNRFENKYKGNPSSSKSPKYSDQSNQRKEASPYRPSAWERLKPKQGSPDIQLKGNQSARGRLKPEDPKLSSKYNDELRKRDQSEHGKSRRNGDQKDNGKSQRNGDQKEYGKSQSNGLDPKLNYCPPKADRFLDKDELNPKLVKHATQITNNSTSDLSRSSTGYDGGKHVKLPNKRLGRSNPNLSAGYNSDIHRSTMSLNESAMSFNCRDIQPMGAEVESKVRSASHDRPHISLGNIGEDVYV